MDPAAELPDLIKHIGRGARGAGDLTRPQAARLFSAMLDGAVPPLQLGAIVLALRMKGESVDELLGFAEALQARTAPMALPDGPRTVLLPSLNGARKLLNLMPLLALHLADQGVPVLIHGRHDFGAARSDSMDLLAALGHAVCSRLEDAERALHQRGLAVVPTALLCPGLDTLLALRPQLGLRNSAHTLAKLLTPQPARSVRVAAVTHGDFQERLASVLPRLGAEQGGAALLLKGCEGEAYPHPRRPPSLQAWANGEVLPLRLGEAVEAPLHEGSGHAADDARTLETLRQQGPTAWPLRLREQAEALLMLSRNM